MTAERVLFATQWYPPEPAEIPRSIALGLADAGFEVEVLTGVPNYPDGRVASGYRAWRFSTETIDGIRVGRTPLYPSHDRSAIRRIVNYLSWAVSSAILGARSIRRADAVLVYSSPATAALGPLLWRRIMRTPYVLLIQDLWPDSVTASGMLERSIIARALNAVLSKFVEATYRGASHVVTISPGMKWVLVDRGVPAEKVSLVYNWSAEKFDPDHSAKRRRSARRRLGIDDDDFVLTYAGNLGAVQGLGTLIGAVGEVGNSVPLKVLIAGGGVEEVRLRQLAHGAEDRVSFLGRLDSEQMQDLRAASDVQFAGLIDHPLFSVTMPSKVQAILASGSPILVCASGDVAAVAGQSGAGWAVDPEDVTGLARAIERAWEEGPEKRAARGRAAVQYYAQHMSRDVGLARLSGVLRNSAMRSNEARP